MPVRSVTFSMAMGARNLSPSHIRMLGYDWSGAETACRWPVGFPIPIAPACPGSNPEAHESAGGSAIGNREEKHPV